MRALTSLMLALMLALTSQSMAVARGASAATGQVVLCTGNGTVAVYVDAEGKPTSPPHICPDAALHVLLDAAVPDVSAPVDLARFDVVWPAQVGHLPLLPRLARLSRGPPLLR